MGISFSTKRDNIIIDKIAITKAIRIKIKINHNSNKIVTFSHLILKCSKISSI